MIGLALLALAQSGGYKTTLVFDSPKESFGRPYVVANVLTDQNLVAGFYCESTGHHGETTLSKPFAWHKGKLIWLPLGKGEYGQVAAGNDQVLIGEILLSYDRVPAKWTPDPVAGWRKPKLTLLGKEGRAVAISKTGDIWVATQSGVSAVSKGGKRNYPVKQFDIVGVDGHGRVWGNSYRGIGFGGYRTRQAASRLEGKSIRKVSDLFVLTAINSGGAGAGDRQVYDSSPNSSYPALTGPAILTDGKVVPIPVPDSRFSRAGGINEHGDVIGYFNVGTNRKNPKAGESFHNVGFVYSKGKVHELPAPAIGVIGFSPTVINGNGAIVGSSDVRDGTRLYLMTPSR